MKFSSLGLSDPILRAVSDKGYHTPSPIQLNAIPAVLNGRDVMAAAQTGTGKTAGFTLPILEKLSKGKTAEPYQVRTLILTPTRELAAQIDENIKTYSKYLALSSTVVFGGVNIKPQISRLKKGVDILVATPGRLMDLWGQKALKFNRLEILVLDEADRMLDMGFIHDIKKVLAILPKKRQNLLFSATFSPEIRNLAKGMINNPIEISVTPRNSTVEAVEQGMFTVDKNQKTSALIHLIQTDTDYNWEQVLVFTRTKHGANRLVKKLEQTGIQASAIHGNKSQAARTKALAGFKDGSIRILVATDIAARGIDISQLPLVVNFDLPNIPEDYVHRIGRTGRAGESGHALSLVSADESKELASIEKLTKQKIPRISLQGFVPVHIIPDDDRPPRQPRFQKQRGSSPSKSARFSKDDSQQDSSENRSQKSIQSHARKTPKHSDKSRKREKEFARDSQNSPQKSGEFSKSNSSKHKVRGARPQGKSTENTQSGDTSNSFSKSPQKPRAFKSRRDGRAG